jgi:hypothetical protein
MAFSLKQYNKIRQEYKGEPKKGEVWEIVEKANLLRPNDIKVPVIVISNINGVVRAYVCTNRLCNDAKQYELKDPMTAGVMDKCFVDIDVVTIPKERLTRRLGKLSGFDKNLIMFS